MEGVIPLPEHLTDRLTYRLALANLAAQIGIVVTGGLVRLTGSGLGCSTWPLCEPGTFTPVFHEAASYHPFVEFGNRTLTGVLVVIALVLLWALHTREPARSRPRVLKLLGWAVLAMIGVQAVVGGISVLMELHPAVVGLHMSLSLVLIAISAYLVLRLRQEDGPSTTPRYAVLLWALAAIASLMMILGIVTTGSGPHSGDENAPYRFAFDPVEVTRLHSMAAWVFALVLVLVVIASVRSGDGLKRWVYVIALVAVQGVIGYWQFFTALPIVLVLIHMFLAALMVAALTIAIGSCWKRLPTA